MKEEPSQRDQVMQSDLVQLQHNEKSLPIVSFADKDEQNERHWEQLLVQMIHNETDFFTGPLFAHMQFSNYCNLSCVMCWNGKNPRTRRLSASLLEKIEQQIGPYLSVIEPFNGSEPLTLTWKETRQLALDYGILLRITTNLQFLDEAKFLELKDITETLCLSVDCHIPEVLEKIRQRAKSDTIFENLKRTARLCREHNVECIVNLVMLTYNAPFLSDTIRYFHSIGIESVNVIQMNDINDESYFFDPVIHFSEEYIEWVKQDVLQTIEKLKMRVAWGIGRTEFHDFREIKIERNPRKILNDHNDYLFKFYFPDFCKHVYNRVRLELDGDVAPCHLATDGKLSLGNLNEQDFDEIWNGPAAQALRRGMYTNQVPDLCQGCGVRRAVPPQTKMAFIKEFRLKNPELWNVAGVSEQQQNQFIGPSHVNRSEQAPKLILRAAKGKLVFHVALAMGGQGDEIHQFEAKGKRLPDNETIEIDIPSDVWKKLRPNVAYWWSTWQRPKRKHPLIPMDVFPCLIKSRSLGPVDYCHSSETNELN